MTRLLRPALAGLATVALWSCKHEPPPPPREAPVIQAYRLYAKDDCAGVRAEAARARSAGIASDIEPYFDLLEAYCLERQGDVDAAKHTYTELQSEVPGSVQGYDAGLRLRDLAFLEQAHTTRAEQKKLAEPRWHGTPDPALKPVKRPPPRYPRAPEAARIEGWVMIDFAVTPQGSVADPVILDSDPPYVFEAAALAALRGWSYEPLKAGETPRASVVLRFQIETAQPAAKDAKAKDAKAKSAKPRPPGPAY